MPPTTSLADCLWILGLSIAIATGQFFLGWSGLIRSIEVQKFTMALSRRNPPRSVDPGVASEAIRHFYRTPAALVVCGLPWLGLAIGYIGVSLLHDAGFMILPWPIAINSALIALWLVTAGRLKFRQLVKMIPVS
jgi:hypothetical protein